MKKKSPKKTRKPHQELHHRETKRISGGGEPQELKPGPEFPAHPASPEDRKKRGIKW
jgi:hypothetical protein